MTAKFHFCFFRDMPPKGTANNNSSSGVADSASNLSAMEGSNLVAPPPTDGAALARQLLRDLEALRKRRHQLEHDINVRDVATFATETAYLQMISTPMCVSTDPVFEIAGASTSNKNATAAAGAAAAATAGQIRTREGTAVATTTAADKSRPVHHLGAIQLGDDVSDEALPRGVSLNDRMFSLSNFTAISMCGKHGLL